MYEESTYTAGCVLASYLTERHNWTEKERRAQVQFPCLWKECVGRGKEKWRMDTNGYILMYQCVGSRVCSWDLSSHVLSLLSPFFHSCYHLHQLQHTLTKKYLAVNCALTSRVENTNLRVELSADSTEACIFKVLPWHQVHSVGDVVRMKCMST